MKTAVESLKLFGAIMVVIVLGELPAVRDFSRLIDEQRFWLLPLTIGMSVVGFPGAALGVGDRRYQARATDEP